MRREDLKAWQLKAMQAAVWPMLSYLLRLNRRMNAAGFLPSDRLFQVATKAYDAIHALNVELHYLVVDVRKREREAMEKRCRPQAGDNLAGKPLAPENVPAAICGNIPVG